MQNIFPNIKGYKKIYSSMIDGFNGDTFRDKCRNHEHTLAIAKVKNGIFAGGYSPISWAKCKNWT